MGAMECGYNKAKNMRWQRRECDRVEIDISGHVGDLELGWEWKWHKA